MAFIGNSVNNQGFTPAIDYFSGNGSTVTFTLSRPVASVAQMIVAIDNVIQNPSSAFTVSGNSITFSSAPLSGTNNIWVEYTSLITTYAALSQSPSVIGDITASGGYLANGNFGNTFVDGTIVDYVTSNGRITVGPADGFTIYNGGPSARVSLASWDTSGNLLLGGITSWSYGGNNGIQNRASAGNNSSIFLETASAAIKTVIASDTNASLATLGTLTNHPLRFNTNDTERMRIFSDGNVAVGSSSVNTFRFNVINTSTTSFDGLQIAADNASYDLVLQSGGASASGTLFGVNKARGQFITSNNSPITVGTLDGFPLAFGTNSAERMRIDSSGNVLINTTSNAGITARLIVQQDSTAQGIITCNNTRADNNNDGIVNFYRRGTYTGQIANTNAATTYTSASDYRLKENIAPMAGALDKVALLKPVTYTWKDGGEAGQGFIAHELQAVVPDCVVGVKDAVETYTDEDGNEQTRIKPQGVDTSFLVATLTAAIQEQQAMIEELKTKLAALEAKNGY